MASLRLLLILCVALGALTMAAAQPQASPFLAGNTYYQRGEYEQARQQYLAQVQQGPVTPALWYNLGNASLKLQQPGWALLYYERAALAMPRHRNLIANREVALASRHVPPETAAPGMIQFVWQSLLERLTLNELAVAAVIFYLLSCVLVVMRLRNPDLRRRYVWLMLAALVLLVLTGALTAGKRLAYYDSGRAMIVADAALHSGPADTFPALRQVYQGENARIVRQEGFWREVALANGAQGWVVASAAEPVIR